MNTTSHLRRNKAPCSKGFQTSFSEFMIQPPCWVKISQFGPRTFCSQQYIFGWKERSQFIWHYYFSIITCWYISSPITDACLVSIKMSKKLVISLTCNVKLLKKKNWRNEVLLYCCLSVITFDVFMNYWNFQVVQVINCSKDLKPVIHGFFTCQSSLQYWLHVVVKRLFCRKRQ